MIDYHTYSIANIFVFVNSFMYNMFMTLHFNPNYTISKEGRIYSKTRKKYLYISTNNFGYLHVRLSNNGKVKTYCLHRLLAMAYIPNPDNLATVNHINGDKLDNRLKNLEWASYSDQAYHRDYMNKKRTTIDMQDKFNEYLENGYSIEEVQYILC